MNISNSEMKLMEIIWSNAPINSGKLAALAFSQLGWKKSTVYTVIKKLSNKGFIINQNAVITPCRQREDVMQDKSERLIESGFCGSLPMFLAAFLNKDKLTKKEAEELKELIDKYTEDD